MVSQSLLGWSALCTAVLALFCAWADHRRTKRKNPDRVGMVNWSLIMVIALVVCAFTGGLWIRAWLAAML